VWSLGLGSNNLDLGQRDGRSNLLWLIAPCPPRALLLFRDGFPHFHTSTLDNKFDSADPAPGPKRSVIS
jgi:hypothetical protein